MTKSRRGGVPRSSDTISMDGDNNTTMKTETKDKERICNCLATTPFFPASKWNKSAQTAAQNIPAGFTKSFNKESGEDDCLDNTRQTTTNNKRKEKVGVGLSPT